MSVGAVVRSILAATLATAALSATPGLAAEPADETLEEIIVTGTSIRRSEAVGALPVQVFSQVDIARSGTTSVTDFIQQIPAMQGFTGVSESVGGTGGGITTASLHDVGDEYTLVLLNGRRVAPADDGTTIDLNTIPLAAIERVEVLTDGASAVYGADAIAGVVNFILKQGEAPLTVDVRGSQPEHDGGQQVNLSVSKGFGDFAADGYAAFFAYSFDRSQRLKASDRDFAATGLLSGKVGDLNYDFFNGSSRSVPPNVDVFFSAPLLDADGEEYTSRSFSPYLLANGDCPPIHAAVGEQCFIDYTSTIEIAPEVERKSVYGSGKVRLGDSSWTVFSDIAFVNTDTVARIAPYPAEFGLETSSPYYTQYVEPFLTPEQAAVAEFTNVKYRLYDMGNRTYDYSTSTLHVVGGLQGSIANWDVSGAATVSRQTQDQIYLAGFPLAAEFNAAIEAGEFDPFPYAVGEMPADQLEALLATQYTGLYDKNKINMLGFDANAQRDLFSLPGGAFILSLGADYRDTSYKKIPADVAANALILFDSPQPSFDLSRQNWGVYTEVLAPIVKTVELTGAVRYDSITGVDDAISGAEFGETETETTYKVGVKWSPISTLALRASYGTGFRSASMREIAQPQVDFGVTGGTYDCPFNAGYDPLGYYAAGYICADGLQYEVFQRGNPELKPETSKQWNAGFVWAPSSAFSAGIDYWSVEIEEAVSSVSESLVLNNPAMYLDLYTTKFKESNGLTYVAILDSAINIGRLQNEGIDWDLNYNTSVGFGDLQGRLAGTYLVRSRYTLPGTADQWTTSLSQYGVNDAVSFRNVITASLTLATGALENTLRARFRSGYTDVAFSEDDCIFFTDAGDCTAGALNVPSYTLVDWSAKYSASEHLDLTFGIQNLFDKEPPLSLRSASSHQLGYDPRYTDSYLRTFVMQVSMKF